MLDMPQVTQTPSAPTYSSAAVVPAVTSVAVFSSYATIAAFNSTVQAEVTFAGVQLTAKVSSLR